MPQKIVQDPFPLIPDNIRGAIAEEDVQESNQSFDL